MQFLWKYIDDLAGKGLEINILAELMFYVAASLVPLALPLAILLASLMTLGNLGENFELTALKASGISLPRIVAPLIIASVILTFSAFLFANYVLPKTNLKMGSLLYDITNQRPELQIREGIFYNGIEDISIRIGKRNYRTNMLYQIKIYDHTNQLGNSSVTVADSGLMKITEDKKYLIFTLFNGFNYTDVIRSRRQNFNQKNTYPFRRDKFEKQEIRKELIGFKLNRTDESLFRQNYRMLSLRQLSHQADSLRFKMNERSSLLYSEITPNLLLRQKSNFRFQKQRNPNKLNDTLIHNVKPQPYIDFEEAYSQVQPQDQGRVAEYCLDAVRDVKTYVTANSINYDSQIKLIRRHDIEWWKKFTLSVSCLIFFLIGAPLGAIIRKGGLGMPVVISVLFFVLWYILSLSSEKFVREGLLPSSVGMWFSSIILFVVGIYLTHKATVDSSIFNIETYANVLKNYLNKVLPKKLSLKINETPKTN